MAYLFTGRAGKSKMGDISDSSSVEKRRDSLWILGKRS